MSVKVMGEKEAQEYLDQLHSGIKNIGDAEVRVGTNVTYAWGIEFGETRGGKLARRAGGSFALTDAFAAIRPKIAGEVLKALPKGSGAVLTALKLLGNDVLQKTKQNLMATVYSTPIPTSESFRYKKRKGRVWRELFDKPMWTRTSNLRRSYHVEVGGKATASYLRSAYYKGGEQGT